MATDWIATAGFVIFPVEIRLNLKCESLVPDIEPGTTVGHSNQSTTGALTYKRSSGYR